jgi:DNA modification methylase
MKRTSGPLRLADGSVTLSNHWHEANDVTLFHGDCRELLAEIRPASAQLIVTSPPYNQDKEHEKRVTLSEYLRREEKVISLCIHRLRPGWEHRLDGDHIGGRNPGR